MTEQKSVWVFIEHTDDKIADVSLELIGKARELADTARRRTRSSACCAGTTWTPSRKR